MIHTSDPICQSCQQKLSQVNSTLVSWFTDYVKKTFPSAHISWGYRGEFEQEAAFGAGKTKLHYPNSAHNKIPALAIDLFQQMADGSGVFDKDFYRQVFAESDPKKFPILWGAMWPTLGDSDHFQLSESVSAPVPLTSTSGTLKSTETHTGGNTAA